MRKKNVLIIAAIVAVAIIAAVIYYIMKKKGLFGKNHELTDAAKDFLQIYHIDNSANQPQLELYMYHTGADSVKANTENSKNVIATVGGVDGTYTVIPISQVIYADGRKFRYNGKTDYILADTIKS